MLAYFASVIEGEERGIHGFSLDTATGALSPLSLTRDEASPMFVVAHPKGHALYAVFSERIGDERKGYIASYAIDHQTGTLTEMTRDDSGGGVPCYIGLDHTASYVLIANYFGATTAVFPIQEDGSLGKATSITKYGDDPKQHAKALLHSAIPSPCNNYVFVADLGNDQVIVHRFDSEQGLLSPHSAVKLVQGAGPRHLVMHLKGHVLYCVNERNSTVTALSWQAEAGQLSVLQSEPILPEDFPERNTGSDLRIHPSGKFLYASNRGHDSLAIFKVDQESGRLTKAGHHMTRGETPRSFMIEPTGKLAVIVNELTDGAVTFWINEETGTMDYTGNEHRVPKAISVALVER